LENGIASLKKAKEQLKTYRLSVLKRAYDGTLTQEWRIKNRPLKPSPKLLGADEFKITVRKDLPRLPENWLWVKIEEAFTVSGGITVNSRRSKIKTVVPYLRVANVFFNSLDLTEIKVIGASMEEVIRYRLENGDLLIVEGNGSPGQIGRVAVWDASISNCIHQNHLIRARPKLKSLSRFTLYWLMSPMGRSFIEDVSSSTSGLHTLSISKVGGLPLPLISIEEQIEIVSEIESRLSEADSLDKTLDAALAQAEALRQSILNQAFEGKLVPQDPNDEPTEKLLERIRAECAAAESSTPKKRGRYGGGVPEATWEEGHRNGTPVEGGVPKPRRGRPPGKRKTAQTGRG
jgi:type I restriction enzyme, S subunit